MIGKKASRKLDLTNYEDEVDGNDNDWLWEKKEEKKEACIMYHHHPCLSCDNKKRIYPKMEREAARCRCCLQTDIVRTKSRISNDDNNENKSTITTTKTTKITSKTKTKRVGNNSCNRISPFSETLLGDEYLLLSVAQYLSMPSISSLGSVNIFLNNILSQDFLFCHYGSNNNNHNILPCLLLLSVANNGGKEKENNSSSSSISSSAIDLLWLPRKPEPGGATTERLVPPSQRIARQWACESSSLFRSINNINKRVNNNDNNNNNNNTASFDIVHKIEIPFKKTTTTRASHSGSIITYDGPAIQYMYVRRLGAGVNRRINVTYFSTVTAEIMSESTHVLSSSLLPKRKTKMPAQNRLKSKKIKIPHCGSSCHIISTTACSNREIFATLISPSSGPRRYILSVMVMPTALSKSGQQQQQQSWWQYDISLPLSGHTSTTKPTVSLSDDDDDPRIVVVATGRCWIFSQVGELLWEVETSTSSKKNNISKQQPQQYLWRSWTLQNNYLVVLTKKINEILVYDVRSETLKARGIIPPSILKNNKGAAGKRKNLDSSKESMIRVFGDRLIIGCHPNVVCTGPILKRIKNYDKNRHSIQQQKPTLRTVSSTKIDDDDDDDNDSCHNDHLGNGNITSSKNESNAQQITNGDKIFMIRKFFTVQNLSSLRPQFIVRGEFLYLVDGGTISIYSYGDDHHLHSSSSHNISAKKENKNDNSTTPSPLWLRQRLYAKSSIQSIQVCDTKIVCIIADEKRYKIEILRWNPMMMMMYQNKNNHHYHCGQERKINEERTDSNNNNEQLLMIDGNNSHNVHIPTSSVIIKNATVFKDRYRMNGISVCGNDLGVTYSATTHHQGSGNRGRGGNHTEIWIFDLCS